MKLCFWRFYAKNLSLFEKKMSFICFGRTTPWIKKEQKKCLRKGENTFEKNSHLFLRLKYSYFLIYENMQYAILLFMIKLEKGI